MTQLDLTMAICLLGTRILIILTVIRVLLLNNHFKLKELLSMANESAILDNSIRVDLTKTNLFFTADLHLGHGNIIRSCDRPFISENQMDLELMQNYNDTIQPGDVVCIIGDLMFKNSEDPEYYLENLGGQKHLILGNHDYHWIEERHLSYFESVKENALVKIFPDGGSVCKLIFLHHYSCRTWPSKHYGAHHLYGHSHGSLEHRIVPGSFDAGVDNWGYRPFSYEQAVENFNKIDKLHNEISARIYNR